MPEHIHSSHRIALVSGGLKLGGSTTFLCNLAGELVRRKIPTLVLSFEKESSLASDFERQHIPVICYDDARMILEDRMKLALDELRKFQPTVVLSTLGTASFEVQRYLPKGIFRGGVAQSDDPKIYPGIGVYAALLDAVAVVSAEMKKKMESRPEFARLPVHNLPYGVPIPKTSRAPQDNQRPLRILYLGRLGREQKRVHLFPQIFEELKLSGIPFHWTIVGVGEEENFLKQAMKNDSPTQTVSFAGKITYAQVPEMLQAHDIYLLASDYEGLPLSLLEAMGAGLVPVVSDLPSGIPEVVHSTNGILVPVDEISGYARGIIHLHEHRDELQKKSVAARARVEKEFSVEAMTDRWLAILPKEIPQIGEWPSRWQIKAPLPVRFPVYFSPLLRPLRRLAMKWRK